MSSLALVSLSNRCGISQSIPFWGPASLLAHRPMSSSDTICNSPSLPLAYIVYLGFPFRASSQGFKTYPLGRGFYTLIKNVLFPSSPIDVGSHNPPPPLRPASSLALVPLFSYRWISQQMTKYSNFVAPAIILSQSKKKITDERYEYRESGFFICFIRNEDHSKDHSQTKPRGRKDKASLFPKEGDQKDLQFRMMMESGVITKKPKLSTFLHHFGAENLILKHKKVEPFLQLSIKTAT